MLYIHLLEAIQNQITFSEWLIGWVCFSIFLVFYGKSLLDEEDLAMVQKILEKEKRMSAFRQPVFDAQKIAGEIGD